MRGLILLLMVPLGCGAAPLHWSKASVSPADVDQDQAACQQAARDSVSQEETPRATGGYRSYANRLAREREEERERIFIRCMTQHGYHLEGETK